MSPTTGNEDRSRTADNEWVSGPTLLRLPACDGRSRTCGSSLDKPSGLPGVGNSCLGYSSGGDRRLPPHTQW